MGGLIAIWVVVYVLVSVLATCCNTMFSIVRIDNYQW